LPMRLELLQSHVVCFIASFIVFASTWKHHRRFSWTCCPAPSQGGRERQAGRLPALRDETQKCNLVE